MNVHVCVSSGLIQTVVAATKTYIATCFCFFHELVREMTRPCCGWFYPPTIHAAACCVCHVLDLSVLDANRSLSFIVMFFVAHFLHFTVERRAIHRRSRRRGARRCLFAARILLVVVIVLIVTRSFNAPVGASAAPADLRRRRASARVRHKTRARPAVRGRRRGQ